MRASHVTDAFGRSTKWCEKWDRFVLEAEGGLETGPSSPSGSRGCREAREIVQVREQRTPGPLGPAFRNLGLPREDECWIQRILCFPLPVQDPWRE